MFPGLDIPDDIREIEDALHALLKKELTSRAAEFEKSELRVELDPIHRSGDRASYTSYLEATIRYPDDDVHDIIFLYITLEGRFWTPVVQLKQGIVEAVDELLKVGRS